MELRTLKVSRIRPSAHQPRETFEKEAIKELADSIENYGLLQPIVVRPAGENGSYQIIAGERRWRAAQFAGMDDVPAIVRDSTDEEQMVESLIENVHREDLKGIEKGRAAYQIFLAHGVDLPPKKLAGALHSLDMGRAPTALPPNEKREVEKIVKEIGKSKRTIRVWLEQISTSEEIQKAEVSKPDEERLSGDVIARLPTIEDEELQKQAYEKIEKQGMTSNEAQKFIPAVKRLEGEAREKALDPDTNVDPEVLKEVSTAPVELQSQVLDKAVEQRMTPEEVEKFSVTVQRLDEEERQTWLAPGIETPVDALEASTAKPDIPEEEVEKFAVAVKEADEHAKERLAKPYPKRSGELRRNWQAHTRLAQYLANAFCPRDEDKEATLVWSCCGLPVAEARKHTHQNYQDHVNRDEEEYNREHGGAV